MYNGGRYSGDVIVIWMWLKWDLGYRYYDVDVIV